jgi:NAD(P)-dependent dehydrogenase (short-subunit alcohol dehydrogenase family)
MAVAKVALITGSAKRRLGWHVADALGRRGYTVVLHYNTSAADAEAAAAEFRRAGIESVKPAGWSMKRSAATAASMFWSTVPPLGRANGSKK